MGPLVRVAVVGAGAVVLSAAAIGGALWLAGDDPDMPENGDVHAAAPGCGVVSDALVTGLVPGAVPETSEHGPLPGGDSSVCSWSSVGPADGPQGVLRVHLSARFTDGTGEEPVSGDQRAREAYAALVPVRGDEVELPSGEGRVWHGQAPGTAELAFTTDNLLVRVSYAGTSGAEPVGFDDARDLAVEFAEQLGEAL
ncbi:MULTISPECIES: hypothetical protein [Nocardiopsis]|uniref:DUF3558 domain-containing protein n=1 Tax=Nocardiopsis sinuspersici TaxID=501010 RepID=A0A1V3C2D2_9ACTN|nr:MULTISPECIES: hypothetical protein [Nocardiopsis]OOC54964.1 hypothetical protein NOSIN_15100 [Nocardiopsis sinuspersici]